LLYVLLQTLCPAIGTPTHGWGYPPPEPETAPDQPLADEVERIRIIRNTIYNSVDHSAISKDDFDQNWTELVAVLGRMDKTWGTKFQRRAQQVKGSRMDQRKRQRYVGQFQLLCLSDQKPRKRLKVDTGNILPPINGASFSLN
jgi:hypothetical protein